MREIATEEEFHALLKDESRLIVVDFYATWCGPCKMMAPVLEQWTKEYTDVVFVKVDVDENCDTAEACEINAMPTFILYKGGEKADTFTGANQAKLKEMIEKYR